MCWCYLVVGEILFDVFINLVEIQQMIVLLIYYLFVLIVSDVVVLKCILLCGVKLGLNIFFVYLQVDSFCDDMLCFVVVLLVDYFYVVLEVIEWVMIDKEKLMVNFVWFYCQGFEIVIDDFGIGYSVLIYFECYNFDYLKIDCGFVQVIGIEIVILLVLDVVLIFSCWLKLMIVVEGVEIQEQVEWFCGQGVYFLQGYWIS